jgi:hypothetical protein
MKHLTWLAIALVVGVLALELLAPALTRLASAATPVIAVAGVVAIAWKLVKYYTRE